MRDSTGHSFASYFKRAVSPIMVLSLLREKPMYGYELSNLITKRSNAKLNIAVLYPVLYRLEEQNFIEITDTVVENGRARNYYAITPTGFEYVEKTVAQLRELTQTFFNVVDQEEVR